MSGVPTTPSAALTYVPSSLPFEIVQQIFQDACSMSTGIAYSLCLASSWTRDLALPALYSYIPRLDHDSCKLVNSSLRRLPLAIGSGARAREQVELSHYVNAIHFANGSSGHILQIFRRCAMNVTHIAFGRETFLKLCIAILDKRKAGGENLAFLNDRKVGLDVYFAAVIDPTIFELYIYPNPPNSKVAPLFNQITRLRLSATREGRHPTYMGHFLKHFPSLTHVAIPIADLERGLSVVYDLMKRPKLEVLVVILLQDLVSRDLEGQVETLLREPVGGPRRFQVRVAHSTMDTMLSEWDREMRGGKSIWGIGGHIE